MKPLLPLNPDVLGGKVYTNLVTLPIRAEQYLPAVKAKRTALEIRFPRQDPVRHPNESPTAVCFQKSKLTYDKTC